MKVLQVTPGTGNFHCGSCLRDLAQVKALRALGHDVTLAPLYLPLVGEADEAGDTEIFFGGINVYLQQKTGFWKHTPRWLDRWLDHPALLRWATSRGDQMTDPHDLGAMMLSMVQGEEGNQAKELERFLEWIDGEERPDLVCISNALLLGIGVAIKQRLGVPVVCTLQGEDSFLDALPDEWRDRCWAALRALAAEVDGFLPVSGYHGRLMSERLALSAEKVEVVHNGLDLDGYAERAGLPDPPVIGFLTRLCPGKGLHTLVDAYLVLRQSGRVPGVRLHIAGAETAADEAYVKEQCAKLKAAGALDDVRIDTNISRAEKIAFLRGLSVLSVPAMYGESFGLYLVEAMACGVPVVQPDHAAFPELIEATGGGVVYDPEEKDGLVEALAALLADPDRCRALGEAGSHAVREQFSVAAAARRTLALFERFAAGA